MRDTLFIFMLWALTLTACTSGGQNTNTTTSGSQRPPEQESAQAPSSLPCAVELVFRAKCAQCHGRPTANTAPMSLTTWGELHAAALEHPETPALVYERVAERIHDVTRPMPPRDQPPLSEQELSLLDLWTKSGAPSGKSCSSTAEAAGAAGTAGTAGTSAASKATTQ